MMDEVDDAILGFHIFIVALLFLAALILALCGFASLVRRCRGLSTDEVEREKRQKVQVEAWEQHRATTAPAELIWEDAT